MTYIPPTNPLTVAMQAVADAAEVVVDARGFRKRGKAIKVLIQAVRAYQRVKDNRTVA